MQECKDRAPGPLEWKDGERERFEKWSQSQGHGGTFSSYAWEGWKARQPEIDALKGEIGNSITLINEAQEIIKRQRCDINSLKAENERLRNAAEEFVRWYDSLEPENSIHAITLIHNLRAALNKGKS